MHTKPIILCAQQRSGTTVLARSLEESGILKNFAEVFNFKRKDELSFFKFKKENTNNIDLLTKPTKPYQRKLFNSYLQFLEGKVESNPYYLIDIKYNAWHLFNPIWHPPILNPQLFKFVKQKQIPILHIKRKNVFQRYVSSQVSKRFNIYHIQRGRKKDIEGIKINPIHCKNEMKQSLKMQTMFSKILSKYGLHQELHYEDMFESDQFSDNTIDALETLTQSKVRLQTPALEKIAKDYNKLITNKEELEVFFKNTKFEKMVWSCFTKP